MAEAMSYSFIGAKQVRQHSHYFKDVSGLNEIDVYMVLKLFNVTDPCLQHIAKKALCAGQRGHKDFKKDLKDILDTAKRAVEINNG
jgi:DNA-binding protein Fis